MSNIPSDEYILEQLRTSQKSFTSLIEALVHRFLAATDVRTERSDDTNRVTTSVTSCGDLLEELNWELPDSPRTTTPNTIGPNRKVRGRTIWSAEQTEMFRELLDVYPSKNWEFYASFLPNKTPRQCYLKYKNMRKQPSRKSSVANQLDDSSGSDLSSSSERR